MGRRSRFTQGQVYAAVGSLLSASKPLSVQEISKMAGVSVGSLYHRFGSREAILAESWLDAVQAFQAGFLTALERGGLEAALETPRFCIREPDRALILVSLRKDTMAGAGVNAELSGEINSVNQKTIRIISEFAKSNDLSEDLCHLALIAIPLSVVQLYLPKRPVPGEAEKYVARACGALLGI